MWPFWIILFPSIADIPITSNGKLHISDLVYKCRAVLGQKVKTSLSRDDVRVAVIQIWKQALPNMALANNPELLAQHFLTLGGSSLSVMWCVERIIAEIGMLQG